MQSGVADDDNVCLFLLHTFRPQVYLLQLYLLTWPALVKPAILARWGRQCCQLLTVFIAFGPPLPCQHLYVAASLRHTLRMRVLLSAVVYLLYVFALIFKHFARSFYCFSLDCGKFIYSHRQASLCCCRECVCMCVCVTNPQLYIGSALVCLPLSHLAAAMSY